jgi:hypothetical protein
MTGLTMLDGKRYYTVFPDEDPELRPRIRAVLDALGNLDKAFRQHLKHFSQRISTGTPGSADPKVLRGNCPCKSVSWIAARAVSLIPLSFQAQ